MLFDKLRQIEERSDEIARALANPAIFSQQAEYARLFRLARVSDDLTWATIEA